MASDVWNRIAREATAADEANVNAFENRSPDPDVPEPVDLDLEQLDSFEAVVNQWMDSLHSQERKNLAVVWFSQMLARLRVKIGTNEKALDHLAELDRIGMAIVSDFVVTIDGHSSVGFERVAPRHSKLKFEGQESIRIVCTEEFEAYQDLLKVQTDAGEIAARELIFHDAVTGRREIRRYALVDGDVRRIKAGRILPQWLNWAEHYALRLIRAVLSEVSK